MKCKYLYDVTEPRKEFWHLPGCIIREDGPLIGQHVWPAGTIEDHPGAYKLVRNGAAEPADDECRLKAAITTKDFERAKLHNGALNAGIQPEDYQRYFDGEILGYDTEGNDIPGPNYIKPDEDEDDDDDDED